MCIISNTENAKVGGLYIDCASHLKICLEIDGDRLLGMSLIGEWPSTRGVCSIHNCGPEWIPEKDKPFVLNYACAIYEILKSKTCITPKCMKWLLEDPAGIEHFEYLIRDDNEYESRMESIKYFNSLPTIIETLAVQFPALKPQCDEALARATALIVRIRVLNSN